MRGGGVGVGCEWEGRGELGCEGAMHALALHGARTDWQDGDGGGEIGGGEVFGGPLRPKTGGGATTRRLAARGGGHD